MEVSSCDFNVKIVLDAIKNFSNGSPDFIVDVPNVQLLFDSIEILLNFTCDSSSKQRIALVSYWHFVCYRNHFLTIILYLAQDHTIVETVGRHEGLQNVSSAIHDLVVDSGVHVAHQILA